MRSQSLISRSSLFAVGLALTGLFVPACDPGTHDRDLEEEAKKHDDCGCKPGDKLPPKPGEKPGEKPGDQPPPKPGDEPGECGPDGPPDECHDAFHACIEDSGTKEECAPFLDKCQPPPPDDCHLGFEKCLDNGGTKEQCAPLLDKC